MPYSAEHKTQTREKIVECARILFNRHGFSGVTIDMIMKEAGLTRGGFYNHFKSKENLYSEAVASFLMGRGAQWRADAGVDPSSPAPINAKRMLKSYLSAEHLGDLDGQCPMIALPSDTARASREVQASYQELLQAMVWLFEFGSKEETKKKPTKKSVAENRQNALTMAALSVGGMILARTLPDSELADEVRLAALNAAEKLAKF